jgi:large subunit ribosomal protein L5
MESVQIKQNKVFDALKGGFGYKNKMQAPKITKVVISIGTGKKNKDKHAIEVIEDRLSKIAGQKAAPRGAKKSIAAFKVREGDAIGYQITLRGKRMYDFLDKLINIAWPRTRDFRGLSAGSIDEMGNFTIGIREHTIFPETSDEDLRDVFGFSVTVVTTATSKEEARALLEHYGFPLKKEE